MWVFYTKNNETRVHVDMIFHGISDTFSHPFSAGGRAMGAGIFVP